MPVFLKQAKLRFICVAEVISKHSSPLIFSFFSISAVKSAFCWVFSACFSRMNTFWGIPISSMYCRKSFSVEVPSGCTIDVPSPVIKIFSMVPFLQSLTASQSLSARSCSYHRGKSSHHDGKFISLFRCDCYCAVFFCS